MGKVPRLRNRFEQNNAEGMTKLNFYKVEGEHNCNASVARPHHLVIR